MLKSLFLLTVLLLIGSCDSKPERPEDIMSESEMVEVLIDIRIAEGQVSGLTLTADSARVLFSYLEKDIFNKFQVDSAIYLKSYEYYMLHPEEFLRITDIVLDSLKVRRQRLTAPSNEDSPIEKE